jgi:hypothetical protein
VFAGFLNRHEVTATNIDLFTVTLCPPAATDKRSRGGDDHH